MAATRKSSARSTPRKNATARTATRRSAPTTAKRDSEGRFKADHHLRNAAVGGAVAVGAVAAGVAAAFKFGLLDRFLPNDEGHEAEDLLLDADDQRGPSAKRRAAKDFRPDIDAPISKADREALRPAKGSAPGFAADRDTTVAAS